MNIPLSPKRTNSQYYQFIKDLDKHQSDTYLTYKCGIDLHMMMQNHYCTSFASYDVNSSFVSCYTNWQKEHEVNIDTNIKDNKIKVFRRKEKVTIDVSVNSLKDLIEIVDKHPYCTDKTYNIDLQALHKIKSELKQFNDMIGLKSLKTSIVKQMLYFIQGFAESSQYGDYKHTVLTGPPGTGKTEVAKLIGNMYSKIGILNGNHFKKVTRTDLIAGYLGQTAIKTRKVIDECLGGVLFIDEAYSLQGDDMYAKECVDTLCEALSDQKKNFMVIIAGYENELNNTFFKINPGLQSRFIWRFNIDPYSTKELSGIFSHIATTRGWNIHEEITEEWFKKNGNKFKDNGRTMEQLFLYSKIAHAQRIYGKDEEKKKITLADINDGFSIFEQQNTDKDKISFGLYI